MKRKIGQIKKLHLCPANLDLNKKNSKRVVLSRFQYGAQRSFVPRRYDIVICVYFNRKQDVMEFILNLEDYIAYTNIDY